MLSFSSRNTASSKSTKVAHFSGIPTNKIPDAHQVQLHQLEEEVKREREEKTKVVNELIELKRKSSSQMNEHDGRRMEMLEKVEKAKQSERKMHESLVMLTRQLAQTKTSLEQARVEISSMKQSTGKEMKTTATGGGEVKVLRGELKSALEAEDKASKAMHELALLLKEVKDELTATKSELDKTKIEVDENAAAWHQKEESFLACVKESTEANNKLKQENTKLFESQKVIREENAKLRENLKKSLEEINAIKEELEMVKDENSRLNKALTEKQDALQTIKLDYESLKVSEAAAQHSLRELNRMLLVETTPKSTSPYFSPCHGCKSPLFAKENGNKSPKEAVSVASSLSSLSEMKAASVAITEDTDQLERGFLISVDGSERKKKKGKFFGKFRSFFKGKGFKPISPLPASY
ncbi:spindle pole body component 110-like protein [Carex littledalei]|uniref:Spindle pole body component 110-like protein n=1 Tax=Carex littledalei TaxID=544730 RepID=A0A833R7G2_9POAL|nr:spindle pole body component 110-like protein [Carex littledalei]